MKTIKENVKNEIIIKNSKFITLLFKINDKDEVDSILKQVKEEYKKATHYCYAYIINDYKKQSDDNEPSNTAGAPLLNGLEKSDISNVLVVTIRYFGGIKLGIGGLIRAYTKSIQEALAKCILIELIDAYLVSVVIDYDMQKELDYILKDSNIISKDFNDKITYNVVIAKDKIDILNKYDYKIIKDTVTLKN